MNVAIWIIISYCSLSILTLSFKRMRDNYIHMFDDNKYEIRAIKRTKQSKTKKYFECFIFSLIPIFFSMLLFALAPFLLLFYLLTGRYKYEESKSIQDEQYNEPINQEYKNNTREIIKADKSKELPFKPEPRQIIYIESVHNQKLNNYIAKEYDNICKLLKKKNFDFIYVPFAINAIDEERIKYSNPAINSTDDSARNIAAQDIYNKILSELSIQSTFSGGLLRYRGEEENDNVFTYFQFSNLDDAEIWEQLRFYSIRAGYGGALYSFGKSKPSDSTDTADFLFDAESKKLIDEIKERVEALRQKGVNEFILKSIISSDSVQLSRIRITNEYKIYLPDYDNLEIKLHPLPKAVFLLFLNHPEGILFKELSEYKSELIEIYKKVSGRESLKGMKKSIDDVVNPTLNSINEKCSRIREAFVKHFDESIARNYFITGDRAMPKKIILDRTLIEFDDTI